MPAPERPTEEEIANQRRSYDAEIVNRPDLAGRTPRWSRVVFGTVIAVIVLGALWLALV